MFKLFVKRVVPEILTKILMEKPLRDGSNVTVDTNEMTKWCLCDEPEYGKMIICDNGSCHRLSSGPYFPYFSLRFCFAPTFPYFFLKMPYYPYFFTLICHLRVKIPEFFPRLLRSLELFKLTIIFFPRGWLLKNIFFYFLLKKSL